MMDVNKSNRLIAEFMGWEISEHELPFRDYPLVILPKKFRTIYGKDNAEPYFQVRISKLIFNKSWDWLMPVLNKIHIEIEENKNKDHQSIYFSDWSLLELPEQIFDVYKEIVRFIEWYNKLKEKKC
jgi:hypothetical protein